jgi:hypothetical protein
VFILKYFHFFFFFFFAVVVCSEGIQMYVDCTAYTHNISDSSENISQSIHFLVTPNERAIVMDVLLFKNILL